MKIWLKSVKDIFIQTAYGDGHFQSINAPIPAILVPNGDRFDAIFDHNFSPFGEVIRAETDEVNSEKILLIQGLTVGLLSTLRDRGFILERE